MSSSEAETAVGMAGGAEGVGAAGAGETDGPCPSCGLLHVVSVERVVVGRDAGEQLGRFVAEKAWRRLLVVSDANTREALGARVASELAAAGHEVVEHSFGERHGLLADEEAVAAVRAAIGPASDSARPDAVVAVGSGVVNDVTRFASFSEGLPYVAVPTAPSMDGYASSVAAMQFDGLKTTLPAQAPLGIFADPAVLGAAPAEMIVWGFGDLIGKATAHYDWVLGSGVAGELFCDRVEGRVLVPLQRCVDDVSALLRRDETAIVALTTGLVESGLAMAMMGNSRPASGCEHHASHFWDLLAYRGLREHAPHGLQVGYATRWAIAVQQAAIAHLGDPLLVPAGVDDNPAVREWYGEQHDALGPVRDEKLAWFDEHAGGWPGNGGARDDGDAVERLRGRLLEVAAAFDGVLRAIDVAGIPDKTGYLGVDEVTLSATLRYANRLRSRFTVLDLLESQGHLDAVADAVVGSAG